MNTTPIGSTGKLQNNIAMPYQFTIGNVISESWKRVKGVKGTYWGATFLYLLIYFGILGLGFLAAYLYAGSLDENLMPVKIFSNISSLVATLVSLPLPVGLAYMAMRRSMNLPIKATLLFKGYSFYWKILGALILIYLIAGLMIFATLFLTALIAGILKISVSHTLLFYISIAIPIVGGLLTFYVFFALSYAPLLIIEKQFGIFQALKTSFLAFKQHGLKIIGTWICLAIIYLISMIPLGIGLIWTLPLIYNVMGIFYRIQFGVDEKA
jgi:hypothetical protein